MSARVAGQRRRYSTVNPSNASYILADTWGSPDRERILPTWAGYVDQGFKSSPIVFGAMLARASLFSEATLKWRSLTDKHLFGSPDLAPLEAPWPNATTGELLSRMIQDADLAGNAYVRTTGAGLERLRPDQVTIVSELVPDDLGRPYRVPIAYYHDPGPLEADRGPALYLADEVAHWSPIPDPAASFRGMSWLAPVLRELESDQGLTVYKSQYLDNAATPNLLIKHPQKIKPATLTELSARLAARHGGVNNAFRTLVLDEGADATVVGSSFESMAFAATQAAGENRILIASGVPGIVVGSREGLQAATYSNYEQAMRRFADVTMRPLWRSVCAALAVLVPVPAGAQLWFDTSDIAALRQGEQERAQTVATKATAAAALLAAGYTPASVTLAIDSGDVALLQHTGLYSVQLQAPGTGPADPTQTDPTQGGTP